MLEREGKTNPNNTLSQYKVKCDRLEDEINLLKSAIYQLSEVPNGSYTGLDKQMRNLQTNIQENQDSNKIKKSVELLINAVSEHKKQTNPVNISEFIKNAMLILGKMAMTVKGQKIFDYTQKLLHSETDEQALLLHFTQLLDDGVQWVNEQINFCQNNHSQLLQQNEMAKLTLSNQINIRLNQLSNHLLIPDALAAKLARLKDNLSKQLTIESLGKVVDNLTDLVIEAFNLEHNNLKGFLTLLAKDLQAFGNYLELSNQNIMQTQQEVKQLEVGLQDNIKAIKEKLKLSKNSKALPKEIDENLALIAKQVKAYKTSETQRIQGLEGQISALQANFTETRSVVDNINHQLAAHKIEVNRDFLTGLPNKVACDEYLSGAYHRWQRGFGEITLVLANIDHFKTINDQYGYQTGDEILKQIASLIRKSMREVDFIARYDGEEFIMILEHTPGQVAWDVLDNLRKSIEEAEFSYDGHKLAVTLSFGASSLCQGDTIENLFGRVVKAMNQAKHGGRNQVRLN